MNAPIHKVKGRVLFFGHCYYNTWYLSRELRKLGWIADCLNFDADPTSQLYYHGQDFQFSYNGWKDRIKHLKFYIKSLKNYDIFHFSGAHNMMMLQSWDRYLKYILPERWDIKLLKKMGKKISYANNACLDGVSQTSFSQWGPYNTCSICKWKDHPDVCSDTINLNWGKFRNDMADLQVSPGGNRIDYNDIAGILDVPGFYCLDENYWSPDIEIPEAFKLPPTDKVRLYHGVGNYDSRTHSDDAVNIKCTHLYKKVVQQLQSDGYPVELIFFTNVPNKDIRYYQLQADICVDMLTYGFFGANIRESLMLGIPSICYLRPQWLESMKKYVPEYVNEMPVINSSPEAIYEDLKDLIIHPEKRKVIGAKSREFAIKWHSSKNGALTFDQLFSDLLEKNT